MIDLLNYWTVELFLPQSHKENKETITQLTFGVPLCLLWEWKNLELNNSNINKSNIENLRQYYQYFWKDNSVRNSGNWRRNH